MQKVITCPCGVVLRGATDEDVVAQWSPQAQKHAKDIHQMDLTKEQALAMARPE